MDITPLQNLSAREWVRAVEQDGFRPRKTGGSHHIYQHSDGRRVLLGYPNRHDTFAVETALYLRQWGVPFDALAHVLGRDAMCWQRAWLAFGRPSLVGTTVKEPQQLRRDLVADEQGSGCLLWVDCGPRTPDQAATLMAQGIARVRAVPVVLTEGWKP